MNARRILLVLVVLFLPLVFTVPAASEPSDSIIVNGADTVRTDAVSASQDLVNLTANVGPRIVAEYANHLRHIGLAAAPSALQTKLDQVIARVVVEFANTIRHEDLGTMPGALGTLMGLIPDRIVFQYANHNSEKELAYPTALFNDTTAPQISDVAASVDSGIITWTTDEFATSIVLYGIQTGVYTGTVNDPLYVKQHQVSLLGITSGTTYYYQVSSTDRSGNTATSSEYNFTAQVSVYLPLVLRES